MRSMISIAIAALLCAAAHGVDRYIYSADGVTVGSSPRELPSQGFDRTTGQVIVGLHARTDAERAACGWWRILPVPAPVAQSNEVWRICGYAFSAAGTATPQYTCSWIKPRAVKYSRLSIYLKLSALGKWDAAETWMRNQGLLTAFMLANEISSDHPLFASAKAQVATALGMSDAEVDAALAECILK